MTGCFLFEFFFQTNILSSLYQHNSIRSAEKTLKIAEQNFTNALLSSAASDELSRSIFNEIECPFIILDEDNNLKAFHYDQLLSTISIRTDDDKIVRVIIDPDEYSADSFSNLKSDKYFSSYSVRLWNSDLYLPLVFSFDGKSLKSLSNVIQWQKNESSAVSFSEHISGYPVSVSNISLSSQLHTDSTELFELLAWEYLSGSSSNNTYLNNKKNKLIPAKYEVISDQLSLGSENYYFFTAKYIDNSPVSYYQLKYSNLVLYVLSLIIMLFVSYYLSKHITRPLVYLDKKAQRIAAKDFTISTEIKSKDELGDLETSLNDIASSMDKALSDIQDMNDKLTDQVELHAKNEKRFKDLLTEMAHEFKTPLNIISSAGSILSDGLNEKDPSYYSDVIVEQSRRLSNMVNEVITLSQLESGYYTFNPKTFSINDLIDDIASTYDYSSTSPKSIIKDYENTFNVLADPERITQVIVNFLSNAYKYSEPDSPIYISLEQIDDNTVRISIRNKGSLNIKDPDCIWEQFSKGDHTTDSQTSQSSGIGLAICSRILELHQSDYGVSDNDGNVCFYFTLPVSD